MGLTTASLRAAVEETVREEAAKLNARGFPGPLQVWLPHLRSVAEAAARRDSSDAAGLLNELGFHLHSVGDLDGARQHYERALRIFTDTFGPDHPNTQTVRRNLDALGG